MKKSRNKQARVLSPLAGYVIGLITALITSITITSILSIFIINEYIDITNLGFPIASIQILSAFTGTFVAIKLIGNKKIIGGAIVSVGYYITLLCISMMFFDGLSSNFLGGLICCAVGSAIAIFVGVAPKKGSHRMRKRKRYC